MPSPSTIFPSLTYDDAPAAIEWLCRVFGFEQRLVVFDEEGGVRHAELSFGTGVVMLGSPRPGEGRFSPQALGGVTQALSLYVEDPDAQHRLCADAGAEIVQPLADSSFGARGYMTRDPEGHLWFFSDYRPGAYWDQEST